MTPEAEGGGRDAEKPLSLGHLPAGPWAFDDEVTRVFDDMLRALDPPVRHDPRPGVRARQGVRAAPAARSSTSAAAGGGARAIRCDVGDQASYIGVEVSPPMLGGVSQAIRPEIAAGPVSCSTWISALGYPNSRGDAHARRS